MGKNTTGRNQEHGPTRVDVRGQLQHHDEGDHNEHANGTLELCGLVERSHADVVIQPVDFGNVSA